VQENKSKKYEHIFNLSVASIYSSGNNVSWNFREKQCVLEVGLRMTIA